VSCTTSDAGNQRFPQIWGDLTVPYSSKKTKILANRQVSLAQVPQCRRSPRTSNVQNFPILALRVSCQRTVAKPVHIVRGV
jgi:hypothetical protein